MGTEIIPIGYVNAASLRSDGTPALFGGELFEAFDEAEAISVEEPPYFIFSVKVPTQRRDEVRALLVDRMGGDEARRVIAVLDEYEWDCNFLAM